MDYDFASLCADHLEIFEKRLVSLKKKFKKEYEVALNVINHPTQNEHREEIMQEIENLFADSSRQLSIFYVENLNKIQRQLKRYL